MNRRGFLRTSAATAGGLLVGFYLPETSKLAAGTAGAAAKLNAFVHVGADDTVTLFIHKAEMGQGTVTSLSMLLAEELECSWKNIRTEFPGVSGEYGPSQGVVGSQSIRGSWESLRRAGASAREMLIAAAAQKWGVNKSSCRAESNAVINTTSNARLSYGSLAEAASKMLAPSNVTLKDPAQFRLVGKATKRLDTPAKVDGSAAFGIDVRLPGMLYAVVERCPVFGGKAASFDATRAKAVPGVKNVFQISAGVAVVADNTWSAMQGRRVLQVKWDEGPVASVNTPGISRRFAEATLQPGAVGRKEGDAAGAL
ncbi:MAG TPA: molybdopterin cofactor-binding domain-containing protein, partial [Candidatus Solibacter sp.]|nr:molybdopterin cofactor-binding domain-containing protein [Candidatus Solibacter sp.]